MPRYQFALILAESALENVTTIEFARFENETSRPVMHWTNANARITITPISSAGVDAGPARSVTFPFSASGFMRLELRTDQLPVDMPAEGVFYIHDTTGRRVAEARLVK